MKGRWDPVNDAISRAHQGYVTEHYNEALEMTMLEARWD